jgi:two-component system, OmpR family, response regulator BaeR
MAYILIVDSQAASRQHLVSVIEQEGHRAEVVATIAEALRMLDEAIPDLLATDVTLTDGTSAGLVQRATELGAKMLMMTGNPDRITEFDGSGQPYLSKPFTPELFIQRVKEILAHG